MTDTQSPRSSALRPFSASSMRLSSDDIARLIPILDVGLRGRKQHRAMPPNEMRQSLHALEDTFASAVQALQERQTAMAASATSSPAGSMVLRGTSATPQSRAMTSTAAGRPQSAKLQAAAAPDSDAESQPAGGAPSGVVGTRLTNQRGALRPSTAPSKHSPHSRAANNADGTAGSSFVPSRPTSSRPPSGKALPPGHGVAAASGGQRQADDADANIVSDDGGDVEEGQWAGKRSVLAQAVGGDEAGGKPLRATSASAASKRDARRLLRAEMDRRERTTDGTAMISVVRENTSALAAMALGIVDIPGAQSVTVVSSSSRPGSASLGEGITIRRGVASSPRPSAAGAVAAAPPPVAATCAPPPIQNYFSNFNFTSIDHYLAEQKKAVRSFYGNRIATVLDMHRQLQDAARPELPSAAEFGEVLRQEMLERQRRVDLKDPGSQASVEHRHAKQAMHAVRLVQPLQATVTARRVRSSLNRRPGTHKF